MSARFTLVALSAIFFASCAAGGRAREAGAPVEAPSAEAPEQEARVEYERILGSFTARPDLVIYLTPAACLRFCQSSPDDVRLEGLVRDFARLGAVRGEAAARLNRGAVLWRRGEHQLAYVQVMESRRLFARAADVEGLAHAYEWLGFLFEESGAVGEAGDHLAVAYQLFGKLGNTPAQARILSYAD